MDSYIVALKQCKLRMEKEDPNSKLSDVAYGLRMLKSAGLTADERRQVLSSTASS